MILAFIGFVTLVVIATFLAITALQILVISSAFGRTEPIGFVFLTLAAGFGWLAWKLAPFTVTVGLT